MNQIKIIIKERAKKIDIELDDRKLDLLYLHMEKVLETNKKFNLTSIKDKDEFIDKHVLDSLCILPYIQNEGSFIDIGSGPGYPGLAIKICNPNLVTTLIDSTRKKVDFLKETISELKLDDIEAIHSRAEDAGININYRQNFDVGVARAVANLPVLLEYGLPLIKVGGIFIAMKGKEIEEEVIKSKRALKELGGEIQSIESINIPGTEYKRNIIIIKKIRQNRPIYPRKAGTPLKSPII